MGVLQTTRQEAEKKKRERKGRAIVITVQHGQTETRRGKKKTRQTNLGKRKRKTVRPLKGKEKGQGTRPEEVIQISSRRQKTENVGEKQKTKKKKKNRSAGQEMNRAKRKGKAIGEYSSSQGLEKEKRG